MAKLNARGRTELVRFTKEKDIHELDKLVGITWQRWTRVYMSDGNVLEKYDVRFHPDSIYPKGKMHSYGWKRKGKMKTVDGLSINEVIERNEKAGWKKE